MSISQSIISSTIGLSIISLDLYRFSFNLPCVYLVLTKPRNDFPVIEISGFLISPHLHPIPVLPQHEQYVQRKRSIVTRPIASLRSIVVTDMMIAAMARTKLAAVSIAINIKSSSNLVTTPINYILDARQIVCVCGAVYKHGLSYPYSRFKCK